MTSCTLENPSVVAQENDTPSLSASSSQTTETAPPTVTRAPAVKNHRQSATVPDLSAQDIGSSTNDLLAASTVGLPQPQTESPEAPAAEHQPHSPAASPPPELGLSSDTEDEAVADVFPCGEQEDGAATDDNPPASQQELLPPETAWTAEGQCEAATTPATTPEHAATTASLSQSTATQQQHPEETEHPHREEPDHHHHPEKAEEPTKDDVYADALENPPSQPTTTADQAPETAGIPPATSQPTRHTPGKSPSPARDARPKVRQQSKQFKFRENTQQSTAQYAHQHPSNKCTRSVALDTEVTNRPRPRCLQNATRHTGW